MNKADHNAGLLFLCVCNPSSGHSGAPAPVGSGTPGPVPLGGTTGRGTGGTTGAGSPSGEPGTPKPQRPKPVILDGPMGGEIGFDGTGQPALKPRSEAISNSEEQSSVNGGSQ
ncbi:MAG: hypothetical protein H6619_03125 [Deltaproteobacteria bacterium]|nr:hypothetical protein [Deltaproteobacteria bacterium]